MASSINNNVNLGGLQDIVGVKNFLSKVIQKMNLPYSGTPAETLYSGFTVTDSNDVPTFGFEGVKTNTGTSIAQMQVRGISGNLSSIYVKEDSSGNLTYGYGQKIGTNWIKIPRGAGNAILYCWGNATLKTGDTVTFPTAFNTTPVVQLTMLSGTNYGYPAYTSAVTSTNFTAKRNDSNDVPCMWFAVGSANL